MKKKEEETSTLYLENDREMQVPDEILRGLFIVQNHRMSRKIPSLDIEKEAKQLMADKRAMEKMGATNELIQMLFQSQFSRMERGSSLLDLQKEAKRLMNAQQGVRKKDDD